MYNDDMYIYQCIKFLWGDGLPVWHKTCSPSTDIVVKNVSFVNKTTDLMTILDFLKLFKGEE